MRPAEIVSKFRLPRVLDRENGAFERSMAGVVGIRVARRQKSIQYFFALLIFVLMQGRVLVKLHDITYFEFACIFHLSISIIFIQIFSIFYI